ncbi:GT-D fold domain-containing glycosyltransferase [Alicyclobacillus fodiniaquatilis]|uniref:GT-D fold domain-containing glycosyltransferase n=1 Tax=Alicyclobacillus fodiniaquatilis TaxID=1661150 RepID=A0ABW4JND5_9BACL
MRIVIPVGSLHLGGGCRLLAETANRLCASGHEVIVLIPEGKPIDYPLTAQVQRVRSLDSASMPSADVYMPNYYTTVHAAYEAAPTKCIRFSAGFEPLWTPDATNSLDTYMLPIPILSISEGHRKQIYEGCQKDSTVVHPGVDMSVFTPNQAQHPHRKTKRICYIARDPNAGYAFKGYEDFVQAMKIVTSAAKHPLHIDMVCTDNRLDTQQLPCRIHESLTDAQLAKLYQEADLFVCTSWFESFGFPVLEAMACKTLVVSTDCGGVSDFITHQQTGFLTPIKNPVRLAKTILYALEGMSEEDRGRMKEQALCKAQEFTWERYATELNDALYKFVQNRPTIVLHTAVNSVPLKNFTYAKRMAKQELWPHLIDLPFDKSLADIIAESGQEQAPNAQLRTLSVNDIEQQIDTALNDGTGFSLISLGDTECGFLGVARDVVVPYLDIPRKGYENAGYAKTKTNEDEERAQLLDAIQSASVIGLPILRHGLTQRPLLDVLAANDIALAAQQWCDSTAAYKLIASGKLAKILRRPALRILCIGNESLRLMPFLRKHGLQVIAALSPVRGVRDVERIVQKAATFHFDLALVAAGAASVPICARLAQTRQVVAIDIGKGADEWVTGIRAFEGHILHENLMTNRHLSQHQKSLALDVQTGYQEGVNELMPEAAAMPLYTFPAIWIQNAARKKRKQGTPTVRHPLWLAAQLRDAFRKQRPLSVRMLDYAVWVKLNYRAYRNLYLPALRNVDILGVPYLEDHASAMRMINDIRSISPAREWVDAGALEQLQYDHLGRFLPLWLKDKRLLVVSHTARTDMAFLQRNGYTVWGAIAAQGTSESVIKQIRACPQFDVALLSGGVETLLYMQMIKSELGRIALDIGDAIRDANRCFYGVQWLNGRIHKTD